MDLAKDNYCRVCRGTIERRGEGPWVHVASFNQRRLGVKVSPDCPGPPGRPETNDSGATPAPGLFVAPGTSEPDLHRDGDA